MENGEMCDFLDSICNIITLIVENEREEIELRRALFPKSIVPGFINKHRQ